MIWCPFHSKFHCSTEKTESVYTLSQKNQTKTKHGNVITVYFTQVTMSTPAYVSTACLSQSSHFKCVFPQNITLHFVLPTKLTVGGFNETLWNFKPLPSSAWLSLLWWNALWWTQSCFTDIFFPFFFSPWPTMLVFREGFQDINS